MEGSRRQPRSTKNGGRSGAPSVPGRGYTLAAFLLALLGLVLFPPGGLMAIACGSIARSRGDRLAIWAIVAGVVSFVASFFIAAWVLG